MEVKINSIMDTKILGRPYKSSTNIREEGLTNLYNLLLVVILMILAKLNYIYLK